MVTLDTEAERTLFFDYFPASLGSVGGLQIQIDFFTVPGQSFYNATRRSVLRGVDGLVFVADSSPSRESANELSRNNMIDNLRALSLDPANIPLVYQWNKRDVERAMPISLMERVLNPDGRKSIEASAVNGDGVWETQRLIVADTVRALKQRMTDVSRAST
ncbi:MAG: ATP/GTP-binding protein [Myxococcota bacterium]